MSHTEDRSQYCPGHYDDDFTLLSGVGIGEPTFCDGTCSGGQEAYAEAHAPLVTIQPAMRPDLSMPYPFHIESDGSVAYQEFWKGDPAALLGFQREREVQHVDLLCDDFLANPQQAVGMFAVFARDDSSVYVLTLPITSVTTGPATESAT